MWEIVFAIQVGTGPLKHLTVAEAKVTKVSCRQLNMPTTKSGSYRAAKDWWRGKVAEWQVALGGSGNLNFL
jgi:hypothetical protein